MVHKKREKTLRSLWRIEKYLALEALDQVRCSRLRKESLDGRLFTIELLLDARAVDEGVYLPKGKSSPDTGPWQ